METKRQAEVRALFERHGFVLLSAYKGPEVKMRFVCSCGKDGETTLHYLQRRVRQGRPCAHTSRLSYGEVRDYFSEHDCVLLSREEDFIGHESRLHFRCPCGNDVETRWEAFKTKQGTTRCLVCARRNTVATTRARNGGQHHFQTGAFRERYREQSLARYGVEIPSQSVVVQEKAKSTLLKRYGVEHILHVPEVRERQRATLREVLNRPEVREKYRKTILARYGAPSLAFLSRRSSEEAGRFFSRLFECIPGELQEKCYFSPHTREFNVWHERCYYKYDFVHSRLKKAIEYNGSRFHPRPEQDADEVGWCLFRPNRTVREAREYEEHKLGALRARGFDVMVVWDHEVKHDSDSVIARCLDFLLSMPGTRPI